MPNFIKVDDNNNIIAVIASNDKTLQPEPNVRLIEVSVADEFGLIKRDPDYYKIVKDKPVKKTKEERDEADKKRIIPVNNHTDLVIKALEKITTTLESLDSRLSKLENIKK